MGIQGLKPSWGACNGHAGAVQRGVVESILRFC